MFINRRNFYYQNQAFPPTSYTQAQIQQYRENVLATRAKLQAYKEAVIEAEIQNRANDAVAFVRGTMIDSPGGTPPNGQDFVPYGHVSRAGSTPQSYSLWGSSGDSNTDSITSHKRKFGKTFCRILTGFAAILILVAVVGIVGIAIYLGYFKTEEDLGGPSYTEKFVGDFRIERGDSWVQDLTFPDSPAFRAKSTKYRNMLRSVFENSALGPSFESVAIQKFGHSNFDQGFNVTFQLNLDRRKIPLWHLRDTEAVIEKILEQELKSPSPVAFQTLRVDIKNVNVKKAGIEASPFERVKGDSREEDFADRKEELELVPLKGLGILKMKTSDSNNNKTKSLQPLDEIVIVKKKPSRTETSIERITTVTEAATTKRETTTTTMAVEKKETTSEKLESTIHKLASKIESTTEIFLKKIPVVIPSEIINPVTPSVPSTPSTPETSSTLRRLIYELSPWKPINPDFVMSENFETETKELPDAIDEKDMIKFLPHEGVTALQSDFSKVLTSLYPLILTVSTTPPPLSPPLRSPSSHFMPNSFVMKTSYSFPHDEVNHSVKDNHGINGSPIIEQNTSHEIDSNHFLNRGGVSVSSTDRPSDETNEVLEAPTIRDIQSILENLLYIATMKPSSLIDNNHDEIGNSDAGSKEFFDTGLNESSKYQNEKTALSNNSQPIKSQFSELTHDSMNSGVKEFHKPPRFPNGQYPLDRFRYHAQKPSTSSTTTERIVPFSPILSLPFNIWNVLTTKKPLLLNTEVVTSTSVNVKYGSTTEPLMPIYIHSSTNKNLLDPFISSSEDHFVIPVISGKEVQYIKVNRTKPNYPNVVIVNLADSQTGESNIGPVLLNDEGREIEFSAEFVESISNLLNQIKEQNEDHEENRPIYETFRNNQDVPTTIEKELSKHINVDPLASNITFWNALSFLSKLYLKEQNILDRKTSSPVMSFGKSSSDLSGNLPNIISNQDNVVHDPTNIAQKNPFRKSKSLKISPTLTLFVVPGKNKREPRLISVFGRSPEIKYSSNQSSANSPIHVFKFKEGQSLDQLLGEIFESISKDKEETFSFSTAGKERDEKEASSKSQAVPPGEDSLKVIEALSKLLTDHYENYNLVFGSDSTKESSPTKQPPSSTSSSTKLDSFKNSNWTDLNEIFPTTDIFESSSESKHPKNDTKSYHKYHHELFPVMTRPLNPIKTTTPKMFTTLFDEENENETIFPDDSVEVVTSFDVSFSVFSNKNKSRDCSEKEFKCFNNKCVPVTARCNMVRDCEDNSDEKNCNCSEMLAGQHYTRKICDGIIDCWDRSDETHCDWCSPGQFICAGYQKCVKQELVCDGEPDCPNGDDERDCVTIAPNIIGANSIDYFDEGYLMVRRKGTWGKLCVENFEKTVAKADVSWSVGDLGDAVCKTLTFDSSTRVERTYDTSPPIFRSANSPYFEIDINNDYSDVSRPRSIRSVKSNTLLDHFLNLTPALKGSILALGESLVREKRKLHNSRVEKRDAASDFELSLQFQQTKCIKRDVVRVKCKELQCGVRPRATTQKARIVGGNNSSPGAWPWHAALYKEGEYQCGATLINEQWLLSAGHCFYNARNAFWVARMGALRRGTKFPSPFEQVRPLSHIFIHPEYVNQGFINDISMLRLQKPVKLNDYVRPVCLPPPGAEITDGQRCTLVGWGQLFEVKKVFPDTLQEVEVPLISTNECRKRTLFLPLYRITEDMFCAGYVRGGRDACLGDSGGPLMCQKLNGNWEVMGVTSNGYGCARPHRPGVYTKVGNYLKWIEQVLQLGDDERVISEEVICEGRRCPLGECIPPSGICDGKLECSDGIDEKDCS